MASSGGGWFVFGIAEDGEANTGSEIRPVAWNADTQQRLLRAAYAGISPPPVLGLEFFLLTGDGGQVVSCASPTHPSRRRTPTISSTPY